MTSIAISIRNENGFRMILMAEGDPVVVGETLKVHYNTPELINNLLDNGNIITLGNTVEESTFTGDPAQNFETIDQRESEIIVNDKNFLFIDDQWLVRNFGEESYDIV